MRPATISATAVLALAASLIGATPAHSGMRKCDSRIIERTDLGALKRAATKSAAGHVLNWKEFSPCMNPGYGFAWIPARLEPQRDGTLVNVTTICNRDRGPWKCELQTRRTYEFSTPVSGRKQKFALGIPLSLGVDEARAFASQAFERGASITVLDACERRADEKRTPQDDEYDRELRSLFTAGEAPFEGSIDISDRGMTLSNNSYSLEFSRASPSEPWKLLCWWQVVIVT